MNIVVARGQWGECQLTSLQRLLEDVAEQFLHHFEAPPMGTVEVVPAEPGEGPRAFFRDAPDDDYRVRLSSRGRLWSKHAYQFAHELCHIAVDYERLTCAANKWFEEAVCELASIFTLRQMAAQWRHDPPFSNWFDYAPALADYARDVTEDEAHQLPVGETLAQWFAANEASLCASALLREDNAVVAVQLLPLLEASPDAWQSFRYLPNLDEPFAAFLAHWLAACPEAHKDFVRTITGRFFPVNDEVHHRRRSAPGDRS